ncbi:dTDP-4-dehydrorhamnose 3,5-epimerase [Pandoraea norimbergensis]|uniref:dTDP-4-dehydrorhamnose 3,5-epimerase n=1 Tax=Pandoraea norimbergensis TaxID=93219 RepID=A0ABN4JF45_9BURK|nr:dTDP-4-dehydrorhamnose 3,5-epimerase [Pandoraea norimbergensis]ALS59547.1 dTDP-4-dehydrorhamnose 3,5-epimerase [Pandoraea norimbergensis]
MISGRFDIVDTALQGLKVLDKQVMGDARGYLERMYCADDLDGVLGSRRIAQINHTATAKRGTVRGMHFQRPPHAEVKLVSCIRGEVFDVAVDLRRDSPTFLQWHAQVLSAENHRSLLIPEGFAHGFQCLSDDCELLYFHTAAYCGPAEGGLCATDARLAIDWPLPVIGLSPRDAAHPAIDDTFVGLLL